MEPMQTARLGPGHYEVLGTTRNCEVMRVENGWYLVIDGDWLHRQWYRTKRLALEECQRNQEL